MKGRVEGYILMGAWKGGGWIEFNSYPCSPVYARELNEQLADAYKGKKDTLLKVNKMIPLSLAQRIREHQEAILTPLHSVGRRGNEICE